MIVGRYDLKRGKSVCTQIRRETEYEDRPSEERIFRAMEGMYSILACFQRRSISLLPGNTPFCGRDLRTQIALSQIGTNNVQLLPSPTQHRPFLENPHLRQFLFRNTTQANQNEDILFVRYCFHHPCPF